LKERGDSVGVLDTDLEEQPVEVDQPRRIFVLVVGPEQESGPAKMLCQARNYEEKVTSEVMVELTRISETSLFLGSFTAIGDTDPDPAASLARPVVEPLLKIALGSSTVTCSVVQAPR
jgi:hypothetical protein